MHGAVSEATGVAVHPSMPVDEARALASQARASAAVLVALPLVFAVAGSAADPRVGAARTKMASALF